MEKLKQAVQEASNERGTTLLYAILEEGSHNILEVVLLDEKKQEFIYTLYNTEGSFFQGHYFSFLDVYGTTKEDALHDAMKRLSEHNSDSVVYKVNQFSIDGEVFIELDR